MNSSLVWTRLSFFVVIKASASTQCPVLVPLQIWMVSGIWPIWTQFWAFGLVLGFLMSFGSMHPPFSLAFFPSQIVTLSPVDGSFKELLNWTGLLGNAAAF